MGITILDSTAECMAQGAVSLDGKGLFVGGTEAKRRELNLVSPAEIDRVNVELWKGAERKLRDQICAGSELVISYRLYALIQEFVLDDAIHFLPADVLTWRHIQVDQYLYGYSTEEHDILDYELANYKTVPGTSGSPVVIEVKKWVALAERIPAYDLFCSAPISRWIVSDRLRDAIVAHGITGCRFLPIEISST